MYILYLIHSIYPAALGPDFVTAPDVPTPTYMYAPVRNYPGTHSYSLSPLRTLGNGHRPHDLVRRNWQQIQMAKSLLHWGATLCGSPHCQCNQQKGSTSQSVPAVESSDTRPFTCDDCGRQQQELASSVTWVSTGRRMGPELIRHPRRETPSSYFISTQRCVQCNTYFWCTTHSD